MEHFDKALIINFIKYSKSESKILNLKYSLCGNAINKNILTNDDDTFIKSSFIKEDFINELNYDNDIIKTNVNKILS